jgi:hypothetical protein
VTGPWVGVDPGAKDTGIVLRAGRDLVLAQVVSNPGYRQHDPSSVGADYLGAVVDAVIAAYTEGGEGTGIAVEGVTRPCPHLGLTDPSDIIGSGLVLGAVLLTWPDAVVVPPGGNGSGLLATYPDGLVTDAERRRGMNRAAGQSAQIRHCRSGWDVSIQGQAMARVDAVMQKAGRR